MGDLTPMIVVLIAVLALITFWSGLVMFIPNLLK